MDSDFNITFIGDDMAVDTILRGVSAYSDYTVELIYMQGVAPYCANPVCIDHTTEHGAVVVHEIGDEGAPDQNREHTIPLEALAGISVL